jgi:outer membrane murein-binding lipoprotein Lpp
MEKDVIITVVAAVIGSNALWGFIQFLIQRKDKKDDCSKKIMDMIQTLEEKIDKLDSQMGEDGAITARVRILKFMDELLEGRRHTKDSYDQVMTDITNYNKYCKTHPDFKNNQTASTIEYINKNYQERLEKHDFL